MNYLMLGISVFIGSWKNLVSKKISASKEELSQTMLLNIWTLPIALIITVLLGTEMFRTMDIHHIPLWIAAFYAFSSLTAQTTFFIAVRLGPVSLCTLFYSCGFIVSTIFGVIYYRESVNVFHIIGILLVVLSFVFAVDKKEGEKVNVRYLIASFCSMIASGCIGISQKLFFSLHPGESMEGFLIVSYVLMIFLSGVIYIALVLKRHPGCVEKAKPEKREKIINLFFIILFGMLFGAYQKVNTYLAGALPSVVVFPVLNGGVITFTAILSACVYKEKLSSKQMMGIFVCVVSIILISLGQIL